LRVLDGDIEGAGAEEGVDLADGATDGADAGELERDGATDGAGAE